MLRDRNVLSLTSVNDMPVTETVLPETGTIRIGPYTIRFARPTPAAPLTIEYEVLGEDEHAVEAPLSMAAPRELPPLPPSSMRDEKFHAVAVYTLRGRYLNKTAIAVLAVLVVWGGSVLVYALGKHVMFMPGSISVKHRLFANNCAHCHPAWQPVFTVVPDKACLSCHSGPPHFSERAFGPAPQCASCHVEHKGQAALVALDDSTCLRCHADLKVREPRIPITTAIHSFMADHPEFAISVSRVGYPVQRVGLNEGKQVVDSAAIKLNHRLHLKPDLMGPDGPEQLSCASCHQADPQGAYMRPVKYEKDCMRCHLLDFDERLPGKTVPHGQPPEEVDRFLRATYAVYYLLQHQPDLQTQGLARRLPGGPRPQEKAWVSGMVEGSERLLLGPIGSKTKGKCVLCHVLDRPEGASPVTAFGRAKTDARMVESRASFPAVVKTAMPERWLPYSNFDHKAHGQLKCVACHEAAPLSERTKDVLLPGIASCQSCHFESGGARTQCLTCHGYHDRSETQMPGDQPYPIEQFKQGQNSPQSIPVGR